MTFELNVKRQSLGEVLAPQITFNDRPTVLLLQKPERDEWGSGTEALECALQLEKSVNQSLLDLHRMCSDHNDPHVRLLTV